MTVQRWKEAVKMTSPVFFGYIAIGIPFGLMCVKAGYPVWLSPVMSIVMFAGAGQYVAMGLFAQGAPLASIAITELLVNSRHMVYGLSLIDRFKKVGKWKPYLIFALTDETYSLLTSCRDRDYMKGEKAGEFCGVVALLDHLYWILGGVIGAAAGMLIPFSLEGVDFALTALFAVLLIEQVYPARKAVNKKIDNEVKTAGNAGSAEKKSNTAYANDKGIRDAILPPIVGALSATAAIVSSRAELLSSGNILIAAMTVGLFVLMAISRGQKQSSRNAI